MQGVVLISIGAEHAFSLAMSTYALRQQWHGPLAIFTNGKPSKPLTAIATGAKADLLVVNEKMTAKSPPHAIKAAIPRLSPFDSTVYLDAHDTLVVEPLDPLFLPDDDPAIGVTAYADWKMNGKQGRFKLDGLVEWGLISAAVKERIAKADVPVINTGVLAFTKQCAVSAEWGKTTDGFEVSASDTTGDELALQVLLADYPFKLFDRKWNVVVPFDRSKQAAIWHLPGAKFGQSPAWPQILQGALTNNWCGVRDWTARNLRLLES